MEHGIGYAKSLCAGSAAHSTRAKFKNYSFTMMLCINRYENYTRAFCNSFQT